MAKKPVHTVPHNGKWANRREGATRVSETFDRKVDAQASGRQTARRDKVEHLVYNQDGKIGQRNSYGNDPHPPKG